MVVVFAALGNGFDRWGGVVDGGFRSRMVSLVSYLQVVSLGFMNLVWMVSYLQVVSLGFMNLVWMNVKEHLVIGLWVYFLDLWI